MGKMVLNASSIAWTIHGARIARAVAEEALFWTGAECWADVTLHLTISLTSSHLPFTSSLSMRRCLPLLTLSFEACDIAAR